MKKVSQLIAHINKRYNPKYPAHLLVQNLTNQQVSELLKRESEILMPIFIVKCSVGFAAAAKLRNSDKATCFLFHQAMDPTNYFRSTCSWILN